MLVVSARGMLVPKRTVNKTIQGDRNQRRSGFLPPFIDTLFLLPVCQ